MLHNAATAVLAVFGESLRPCGYTDRILIHCVFSILGPEDLMEDSPQMMSKNMVIETSELL